MIALTGCLFKKFFKCHLYTTRYPEKCWKDLTMKGSNALLLQENHKLCGQLKCDK